MLLCYLKYFFKSNCIHLSYCFWMHPCWLNFFEFFRKTNIYWSASANMYSFITRLNNVPYFKIIYNWTNFILHLSRNRISRSRSVKMAAVYGTSQGHLVYKDGIYLFSNFIKFHIQNCTFALQHKRITYF